LTPLPAIAAAQAACPGIHVKILDIRNSASAVACALFESSVGFPCDGRNLDLTIRLND
jgi:uncharacterized protein (DUF2141 family)